MSEKDFNDLDNQENQDNNTQDENIDDKKNELEDKKDEDKESNDEESLEDLMEKMQKLVEEVSDEYGVDPDKIKVMAFPQPKFTFLSIFVSSLVIILFDVLFIVAFSAFFDWATYSKNVNVIYFALIFAGVDVVLKLASLPLFKIKTNSFMVLSIIKVMPYIITCILCGIWPLFIGIDSYLGYIAICIIAYAGRKFYTTYFLEKQMNRLMKKHSKNLLKRIEKKNNKK